jgi:uncharacterized protein YbjT (DUF2867 family)
MILVVGATGTVGSRLVARLHAAGHPLRVLVRDLHKVARLPADIQRVQGDLDRPDTLPPALAGAHTAYLISTAGQVPVFLAAAKAAGVRYLVRQSTLEAGAEPPYGPGVWHREAERAIEDSGLAWAHLRPTMMMSNTLGWWAQSIRTRGTVFFPGGQGQVSPVHPDDVAAVAAVLLTDEGRAGQVYEVTGPELLTIADMVATLAAVLGRPVHYVDVPEQTAREWMTTSGMDPRLAAALAETMTALRANRFARIADTVPRLTGRPAHSYHEWCRHHADLFQPSTSGDVAS